MYKHRFSLIGLFLASWLLACAALAGLIDNGPTLLLRVAFIGATAVFLTCYFALGYIYEMRE